MGLLWTPPNLSSTSNNRAQSQDDSVFIHFSFLSYNFKNQMTCGFFPPLKPFSKINNDYPGVPPNDFQSSFPLKSFPLKEKVIW